MDVNTDASQLSWAQQLEEHQTQEKFQKAMETAETCEDFMERGEENVNGR